jgi:protease-4
MKNPFVRLLIVVLVIIGLVSLVRMGFRDRGDEKIAVGKNGILQLELEGVIMNGKRFLKNLKKYREDKNVKAVLVVIDSPGGSVGPSQEIYSELLKTKTEFKLPIICVSNGLVASGAYYSAAACDKLVVAKGALVGSIGVIMSFANLEKLYDWAKVSRYSITSGRFKDSGAEYRAMRSDEKELFQDLINDVFLQFKSDIVAARKMKREVVDKYADGRVFTGAKAVELGFADKIGDYQDAVNMTAEAAGLGKDYEIFEVPRKKRSIFDFGTEDREDPVNSFAENFKLFGQSPSAKDLVHEFLKTQWLNQPVLLMPGFWQ